MPARTIACAVITYNREDFIETCVRSLLEARSETLGIDVTVINNGAPDNTAEVLAELERSEAISVVTQERNMPLVEMLNEALRIGHASGCPYMMICNDDIAFRPGAIAEMLEVCEEVGPHSLVTPLQINYRKPDLIDETMLDRLRGTDELLNDMLLHGQRKRYYEQRALIGAAVLARSETYAAIGDYDTMFNFYGPDDDFSNRAWAMGIPQLVAMKAEMLHMHGRVEAKPQTGRKAWMTRWTKMYRGRMIYIMKDRKHSALFGYLKAMATMLIDIPVHFIRRFPAGSATAAQTLKELIGSYGRLRGRRAQEDALIDAFRTAHGR